jgi:hypothetical protein
VMVCTYIFLLSLKDHSELALSPYTLIEEVSFNTLIGITAIDYVDVGGIS